MLIDINMLMMQITDIKMYAKNPLQFFAPTLHDIGIGPYDKGDPGIVNSVTAYNAQWLAGKRDVRYNHVLRPCWTNENTLKSKFADISKIKIHPPIKSI